MSSLYTRPPFRVNTELGHPYVTDSAGHTVAELPKESWDDAATLANAHLFAAAPDMLDALRAARTCLDDDDRRSKEILLEIDDAIRQATGGAS